MTHFIIYILSLSFLCFPFLTAKIPFVGSENEEYVHNPHVPLKLWNELKPYFLPFHHPIKKKLDRFFQKSRVTLCEETFLKAGFKITRKNRPINAIVTGHKKLQGFLLKVYLDNQLIVSEGELWLRRIKGCEVIQSCLKKHGYTQFVLPKKWIYPLPEEPSPPLNPSYNRKNFILVVENMNILKSKENFYAYKHKMTRRRLNELYTVLMECQLTDCVYIGNIPFTQAGKIAFVDTELYFNGIPNFNRFKKYLSASKQAYLEELIQAPN